MDETFTPEIWESPGFVFQPHHEVELPLRIDVVEGGEGGETCEKRKEITPQVLGLQLMLGKTLVELTYGTYHIYSYVIL